MTDHGARRAKLLREGDREELTQDRTLGSVDLTRWTTPAGRVLAAQAPKVGDRVGARGSLIIILVIGAVVAFLLSFIASRVYDAVTESDSVAGLDKPIMATAISLRSPVLDAVVTGYTDIAGPIGMPIIAVAAILILSLRRKSWTPAILIAAAAAGSLAMTIAGKDIINRVRPPLEEAVPPYEYSPSFPSGHALNAVVVAGVIAYLVILRRKSVVTRAIPVVIAVLFALTIGLSRVFLGHHWFTDVLAAWALGGAWLAIVITAHRLYLTTRVRRPAASG
jgi:membrane-associated phospholipid phosphatase